MQASCFVSHEARRATTTPQLSLAPYASKWVSSLVLGLMVVEHGAPFPSSADMCRWKETTISNHPLIHSFVGATKDRADHPKVPQVSSSLVETREKQVAPSGVQIPVETEHPSTAISSSKKSSSHRPEEKPSSRRSLRLSPIGGVTRTVASGACRQVNQLGPRRDRSRAEASGAVLGPRRGTWGVRQRTETATVWTVPSHGGVLVGGGAVTWSTHGLHGAPDGPDGPVSKEFGLADPRRASE